MRAENVLEFPAKGRAGERADEAERALLGSCLLDEGALREAVGEGVEAGRFWLERHRVLWGAFGAVVGAGVPLDIVTVTGALLASGEVERAGGLAYVAGLPSEVPTAANAAFYASQVVDAWRRREVRAILGEAQGKVEEGGGVGEVGAWLAARAAELERVGGEGRGGWESARDVTRRLFEEMERAAEGGAEVRPRFETGLADLDRLLEGGLRAGELALVIAPTGMGKSSVCRHLAMSAARQGWAVDYYATEEDAERVISGMCATVGRYAHPRLLRTLKGALMAGEEAVDLGVVQRAMGEVARLGIRVRSGEVGVGQIEGMMRGAGEGRRLVVVDYFQDLRLRRPDPRERVITSDLLLEAMRGLARAASETGAAVLVACQPSRDVLKERRAAEAHDIADCPRAARLAHVILSAFRPWRYDKERDKREFYLNAVKGRGCAEGEVLVKWTDWCTRLDDAGAWRPVQPERKGGRK